MARLRFKLVLVLLAGSALACATGEANDPCWSDWECSSGSCSFGSCDSFDSSLLSLLEELFDTDDASAAPRCEDLDVFTCSTTPGCATTPSCSGDLACLYAGQSECEVSCGNPSCVPL